MKDGLTSPIIQKYQKALMANANSRVFAPLAESYRKLGLYDKAFEVLREGIKRNPDYVLGYLGLAFCYFDKEEFQLVYTTLRPLVHNHRDNLRLQKLFAEACLKLKHIDEALETYKHLLFLNPKDKESAEKVKTLDNVSPVIEVGEPSGASASFDVGKINSTPDSDVDSWVQKDFSNSDLESEEDQDEQEDNWTVRNETREDNEEPNILENIEEREYKVVVEKKEETSSKERLVQELEEGPVITHTLVDLYCAQGHFGKAVEILEKILALDPNDESTRAKLIEVKEVFGEDSLQDEGPATIEVSEEEIGLTDEAEVSGDQNFESDLAKETFSNDNEGRQDLMNYFDSKVAEHKEDHEENEIIVEEPLELYEAEEEEIEDTKEPQINMQHIEKRDKLMSFLGAIKVRASQAKRVD
ncbi:MAG: tetratricopeptide repeat protein [Bacteriovoracaceae bacterium]|nr:tetratricopeptide repeat protein [Bacteriovoracaceae bacterium]